MVAGGVSSQLKIIGEGLEHKSRVQPSRHCIITRTNMKLETLIKQFKIYYVNPNLTSKNFPEPKKIQTKGAKIIKMDKTFTSEEALAEIKKQGCRPANIYELAQYLLDNPKHEKSVWYSAFGSQWEDSDGDRRVPFVDRDSDGDWEFSLGCFEGDWDGDGCLVCFCDETLDTQTLESPSSLTLQSLEKRVAKLESIFNREVIEE